MKILCVIPARFAATRLPGKPLVDIGGKPMIQHVYERAVQAKYPSLVVVATDNEDIRAAVESFGGKVMMTAADHPSGTDRLAEVAEKYSDMDVVINVQGDEPLLDPAVIDRLAEAFIAEPALPMATMMTDLPEAEWNNPNAVKVVTDRQGHALYFSRSCIPYPRKPEKDCPVKLHVGLYGYRRDFLMQFARWEPTPLERTESLEQLRVLENGYKIKVIDTPHRSQDVNTPEDLERVRQIVMDMMGGNRR